MKPIIFKQTASQKIYDDYIKRIKRMVSDLPKEDRLDVLMEFNSHIYESTHQSNQTDEVDDLMDVLEKLGSPEEVLIPLKAEKKLEQATRTFNPIHVFKAIALNLGNGVVYIVFALLYLFLGAFVFCIFAKVWNPSDVGMFFSDGTFQSLGMRSGHDVDSGQVYEVLGNWFIPVMIVISVIWYLFITLLLRIKKSLS